MDPRGVGLWDMQSKSELEEAIWALDHDEAGINGDVSRVNLSYVVIILTKACILISQSSLMLLQTLGWKNTTNR